MDDACRNCVCRRCGRCYADVSPTRARSESLSHEQFLLELLRLECQERAP